MQPDPAVEVAKIIILACILYFGLKKHRGSEGSVVAALLCFLAAGGCAGISTPENAGAGLGAFVVCLVAAYYRLSPRPECVDARGSGVHQQ